MTDITVFEFNFGEGSEFNPRSTIGLPSALADAIDPDDEAGATDDETDDEADATDDEADATDDETDDESESGGALALFGLLAVVAAGVLVGRRLLGDDLDELEELDDLDDLGA